MDEPTATLTPAETERLFALIGALKADGVTIVYISHKLDEVERITDEVIVMRDGRFVARAPTGGAHAPADGEPDGRPRALRPVSAASRPRRRCAAPLLQVQGLCGAGLGAATSASRCAPGEILGFAGLVGAGRTELFEGAARACGRAACGRVELDGRAGARRAARATRPTHGLTYLSEDRKGKGLHVDFGAGARTSR